MNPNVDRTQMVQTRSGSSEPQEYEPHTRLFTRAKISSGVVDTTETVKSKKKSNGKEKKSKEKKDKKKKVSINNIDDSTRTAYIEWSHFLRRLTSHDEAITHVSQCRPKMNINLPSHMEDIFFEEYEKARKAGLRVGIAEKLRGNIPVLIDIDWRFSKTIGIDRKYTLKQLKGFVKCVRDAICHLYNEVPDNALYSLILEKGETMREYDDKMYKDGWHIHFPFCYINNMEQRTELRKHVLKLLNERAVLKDLISISSNTLEDAYDAKCLSGYWLLYGSCKETDTTTWKVRHCFDYRGKKTSLDRIFPEFKPEQLPQILSVTRDDRPILQMKDEFKQEKTNMKIITRKEPLTNKQLKDIRPTLKEAESYLKLLNKERWDEYYSWIEMGWIIHNISHASDEGLSLWKKYSSISDKYDENKCDNEWTRMKFTGLGIGTLKWYARKDNEKKYKKLSSKKSGNTIMSLTSNNSYDIAKYIFNLYQDRFACVDIKKDIWYEFRGHRWHLTDSGCGLEMLLPEDVSSNIQEKIQEFSGKETQQDIVDKLRAVIKKLKNSNQRAPIMRDMRRLFYQEDFMQKLDSNKDLLCCNNGVYDIENDHFRDGRPTDRISFCTGITYDKSITWEDPRVKQIHNYLKKVFPNQNNRNFFVRWVSRCIRGGNFDKIFLVWIGVGDNAKSITSNLLEATFGTGEFGYMIKFPIDTLIGGYAKSNSTTSDLARMHGKRIGGFQEPPQSSHINVSKIKELTGGDPIYTRELFQKGRETQPDLKFFLQCNHAPKAPSYDKAYYNRLRILKFEATFDDDAPIDENEQWRDKHFPKDPNFKSYLPYLAPAFLWLLIQEYRKTKKQPLVPPLEVEQETRKYRKNNDAVYQFVDQYIVEDKSNSDIRKGVSIREFYQQYKAWFRENFPGSRVQDNADVLEDLMLRWGRPNIYKGVHRWMYRRFRDDNDDQDDDMVNDKKDNKSCPTNPTATDDEISVYTMDAHDDKLPIHLDN